jgi:parallel beta-helix repeat protein
MKLFLISALALLFINITSAATYYIDNSGNDSNTGLTESSPWKTIAKVNSRTFSAGDKILFKRGDTWYEAITVKQDNILFGAYGSGPLPVIDGQLVRTNNLYMTGRSGVTIQNLEFRNNAGSGSIRVQNSNKIIVENCIVYATAKGIFFETSRQCTVRNNTITTPTYINTQTDGIYSQRNNSNVYENNYIVISNTAVDQHNDGIQCYLDTSIVVRGNYIEQDNMKTGNSQGIYSTNTFGKHIWYNNVINTPNIRASSLGFHNLETTFTGTVEIYHNTVIQLGGNAMYVTNVPNLIARNNIFMSNGTTYVITIKGNINNFSNLNYNIYFNKGTSEASAYLDQYGGNNTLSQLKARGAEANGLYGNPGLGADWKPSDGSIAVDRGLNLPAPFNIDKIGTNRPVNIISDMGAYEKISEIVITPPAVPGSLEGDAVSPSQVNIGWTAGCTTEDGFRIERRLTGGVWSEIKTVGSQITSYQDTGLLPSTSYSYRVRSFNSAGHSDYSNECTSVTGSNPVTYENIFIEAMGGNLFFGAYTRTYSGSTAPRVVVFDSKKSSTEHTFTVTNANTYYLKGRFFHGSRGTQSFTVEFNGSKQSFSNSKKIGLWHWGNKVLLGNLNPGTYTLKITNSKPSADSFIDMLLITNDPHDIEASKDIFSTELQFSDKEGVANYPNPFNPLTTIIYNLPSEGVVTLKIYDILGNEVAVLADEFKSAGTYESVFNGSKFSSGIYILELRTKETVYLRKMNLLK